MLLLRTFTKGENDTREGKMSSASPDYDRHQFSIKEVLNHSIHTNRYCRSPYSRGEKGEFPFF